jgi:hypothetical protein
LGGGTLALDGTAEVKEVPRCYKQAKQYKDNSFHGKRNIAKVTRSTIWGVQLKSGDN